MYSVTLACGFAADSGRQAHIKRPNANTSFIRSLWRCNGYDSLTTTAVSSSTFSLLQAHICSSAWAPASACILIGTRRRCAACLAGEATSSRAWAGTSCWAMRPTRDPSWLAPVKASFLRLRSLRPRAACLTPIQINTSDRSEHIRSPVMCSV